MGMGKKVKNLSLGKINQRCCKRRLQTQSKSKINEQIYATKL